MSVAWWLGIVISLTVSVGPLAPGLQHVWAQRTPPQQHTHASPHGGQVVTAGPYHIEMVVKEPTTVQVYLYDGAMQPTPLPVPEATFYLRLPGKPNHTLTLTASKDGAVSFWTVTTELLRDVHTFDAALRLPLDGEVRNVRFTYRHGHGNTPHKH